MEGLKNCVRNNFESRQEASDMMGNEIISFFMRQCMRRSENQTRNASRNEQLVADLISSDSDDEYEESTTEKMNALPCAPS